MLWTQADQRRSREYTNKVIDLAEQGCIDWETLARDALGWMSDAEVKEFAERNDYLAAFEEEEELDDEEE